MLRSDACPCELQKVIHTILGLLVCFFFDLSVLKLGHVCIRRREETDKQRQRQTHLEGESQRDGGDGGGGEGAEDERKRVRKEVGNVRSTETEKGSMCVIIICHMCVCGGGGEQTERQTER